MLRFRRTASLLLFMPSRVMPLGIKLSPCVCAPLLQCIARDVDGKREVAGVHWDYDCYGAPGKIAQVACRPIH